MLNDLAIENFKPFGSPGQRAPLSKITLIYGPNSSGKSSLIQALLLLRQTFEGESLRGSGLIPRGEYVDLGSFRSLIHRHDISRAFSMSMSYDRVAGPRLAPALPSQQARRTTLTFRATGSPKPGRSRRKDSSELAAVHYMLDEGRLLDVKLLRTSEQPLLFDVGPTGSGRALFQWADAASIRSYAEYLFHFEQSRRDPRRTTHWDGEGHSHAPEDLHQLLRTLTGMVATGWRLVPLGLVGARRAEGVDAGALPAMRYSTPLERLGRELALLFGSIEYLGPLRSHPARHYLVTGGPTDTVGVRGENTPQVIYRAPKEISQDINQWFARLEIPYQMRVKPIGDELTGEIIALHLKDNRSKLQVAPSDVGFGIGQLLPILVQGLVAEHRVVCVEQPEIHLHPKLQAHLADFFMATAGVDRALKTTKPPKTQWLIETHSEALMLRLQRRIREGRLGAEDVSVLYVSPGSGDGSRIIQLRLSDDGQFIDEWPFGFFEERFEEIFTPESR